MINSFLNPHHFSKTPLKRQKGAATLVFTVVLLVVGTLIILFAANFGAMQEKAVGNLTRNAQAFGAADAGLEYGISYLKQNYSTITGSPSGGFINYTNSSLTNVTLANNSKFSVTYTNPTANNYNVILITSTGVNDDGSATRVISQLVDRGSILSSPSTSSLVTKGQVNMSGNATVTNTFTNQTIQAAEDVNIGGSSQTITSSGVSSTSSIIRSDVQRNVSSLQSLSNNDFFATYFGTNNISGVKGQMVNYFNNSSNTNYSTTLNNMSGTSIWIDQTSGSTATINGTTTIGTASNPVLLVVNGNLSLSGNITIYGYVFVFGSNNIDSITGNVQIIGGMATAGDLRMSGNIGLTYNPTVLTSLETNTNLTYYAKIPGSWKDF